MLSNALGSAQWLPDDVAESCMRCGEEFTAFTRRHHCRQCGQIFCHRCCNSRALLQPGSGTSPEDRVAAHPVWGRGETDKRKPQKVCGQCFTLLLPMQPYLTATHSKATLPPDFSEASMFEWAGKPISRSFKLEIKRAVRCLCNTPRSSPHNTHAVRHVHMPARAHPHVHTSHACTRTHRQVHVLNSFLGMPDDV